MNLTEDDRRISSLVRRAERELLEAVRIAQRSKHSQAKTVHDKLVRITASLGDIGTVANKYASDADSDSMSEDDRAARWREKRREEREQK